MRLLYINSEEIAHSLKLINMPYIKPFLHVFPKVMATNRI